MTRIADPPETRFQCDECGAMTPSGPGWEPIKPIPRWPEPVRHRCPDCVRARARRKAHA